MLIDWTNTCWTCFWKGSGSPNYFSSFPNETVKNFDQFIRFLISAEWNLNSLCLTEAPKILQKLSTAFRTQHSCLPAVDSDRRPVRTHRGATVLHFTNHCAIFYRCRGNIYCDVCMNMKLLAVLCLVEGWINNESFSPNPQSKSFNNYQLSFRERESLIPARMTRLTLSWIKVKYGWKRTVILLLSF